MTRLTRITAGPRDPATGVVVTQRFAGGGQFTPYYFDGYHWRAGLANAPRYQSAIGWDDSGWTSGSIPTTGTIGFAATTAQATEALTALYWPKAAFLVETAEETGAVPVWSIDLTGTVASVQQNGGMLVFTLTDLAGSMDLAVVTARFAGTGGAEGQSEAAQRIKRRTWGRAFNLEGRVLDKAYNIYEFGDLAFPWQSFDKLSDIGRAGPRALVPWQGSIDATLAALRGTAAPAGGGLVAPSIACAKWWTQPSVLTADVRGEIGAGYVETVPAIVERVMAAAGAGAVANAAAMTAVAPGIAGYHIDTDTETVSNALDRLLLPLALTWAVDPIGPVRILPITFDAPIETVRSLSVSRKTTLAPMSSRRVGYQRAWRTHGEGEISATLYAQDVAFADGRAVEVLADVQPGATVGAPAGTYVGSTLAQDIERRLGEIEGQAGTDTTPPGVPTGLTISSVVAGTGTVDLTASWNAVTDADLAQYDLQIALAGGGFVSFPTRGTSYVFRALPPAVAVAAKVRAVDNSGNSSGFSATVSGSTTRDTTPPAPPTAFAVETSFGAAMLSWTNASDSDLQGVRIFEAASSDFATAVSLGVVNTTPGRIGRFSRTGLPNGQPVWYWIQSIDTSGNVSDFIGSVMAVTKTVDNADLSPGLVVPGDVTTLPSPIGYNGPRVVYNRTDSKLYRLKNGQWTVEMDGADMLVGTLTGRALKAYSVTAAQLGIAAENLIPMGQMLDGTLDGFSRHSYGNDGNNLIQCVTHQNDPAWPSPNALFMHCAQQGNRGEISLTAGSNFGTPDGSTRGFPIKAGAEFLFECVTFTSNGAYPIVDLVVRKMNGTFVSADGKALVEGGFIRQSVTLKNYSAGDGLAWFRFSLGNGRLTANNADVYWWNLYARERNGGQLIVDGGITARHVFAETFTGDVIKAGTFTGDRFDTGTSLPGSITVGATGVSIETIQDRAANPAMRINAGTTRITPGMILLAGTNPLSNWITGGDNALFNGGFVAANTIRANAVVIGIRGVQTIDVEFDTNRADTITWTPGFIEWQDENGGRHADEINAGSLTLNPNNGFALGFVWFDRVSSGPNRMLYAGQIGANDILANPNNVILASYRYGTGLIVYNGRTIIDGDHVKTRTLSAEHIETDSLDARVLKAGIISAREIGADAVTAYSLKAREIDAVHIRINGVDVGNLAYGSTMVSSLYQHLLEIRPGASQIVNNWFAIIGIGITPTYGSPLTADFNFMARTDPSAGVGTVVFVRVMRVSDGTIVWGGPGGVPYWTPASVGGVSVSGSFTDTTSAGVRQQYDVQVTAGAANLYFHVRTERLSEPSKSMFQEFGLFAPSGVGPGQGTQGGGSINGASSGSGGTGGTSGTGGNAGRGGLAGRTQEV